MQLILIVLGFVSLVSSIQLPWMFVGTIGYLSGSLLADFIQFNQSEWQILTFAGTTGLVGIILSFHLRRAMVVLAGFLAGGIFSVTLPQVLDWKSILVEWQAFILVGSACALILVLWYHLALVLVSTVLGATLVIQNLILAEVSSETMFVVLIFIGITVQYLLLQYAPSTEED